MPDLDYQDLISVLVSLLRVAVPVGVIFSIGEWCVTFFFECAFPKFFKRWRD